MRAEPRGALILRCNRLMLASGVDRSHGTPGSVGERVVDPRAVRECVLDDDAPPVRETLASIVETGVDLDA